MTRNFLLLQIQPNGWSKNSYFERRENAAEFARHKRHTTVDENDTFQIYAVNQAGLNLIETI
jgi:hypothetical protein